MRPTYIRPLSLLFLPFLLPACATDSAPPVAANSLPPSAFHDQRPRIHIEHWGAMREVLRDGHTQGRVSLAEVVGPNTIAVGALAGLAAEITVDGGAIQLAEVIDPDSPDGLRVRSPIAGEEATLLMLANVEEWSEHALPAVPDVAALELSVRSIAQNEGIDVTRPFPFRVEGLASDLSLHVLNHSCPIADPNGPQPWTFSGQDEKAALIGFYAENSAGKLTHHGQQSHIHALVRGRGVSGHLDEVRLVPAARLFLPRR